MNRDEYLQNEILKRLPNFELSYETISHKKVSSYNMCMAIPLGKKSFMWFTYNETDDVCYMLELNKEKRITHVSKVNTTFNYRLSYGTIVYGTSIMAHDRKWFVVEDIFYYQGVNLKNSKMLEKLGFVEKLFENTNRVHKSNDETVFMLASTWKVNSSDELETRVPTNIACYLNYPVHHIQYRSVDDIMPYLNVNINRKFVTAAASKTSPDNTLPISHPLNPIVPQCDTLSTSYTMDFFKSQYKFPTIFQVTADIQFDIYHLYAYERDQKPVYYGIAYVPNYKSSVFLNGLFRNIRENKNLDYIEESDDEEDFQNTEEDRYVDLKKVLLMECVFNYKFKKWTPVKVMEPKARVVQIENLVKSPPTPDNRSGHGQEHRQGYRQEQRQGHGHGQRQGHDSRQGNGQGQKQRHRDHQHRR